MATDDANIYYTTRGINNLSHLNRNIITQGKIRELVAIFEEETEQYLISNGCNTTGYRVEVSADAYSGICIRVYTDLDKENNQKLEDILTEIVRKDNNKGFIYPEPDGALLYETNY